MQTQEASYISAVVLFTMLHQPSLCLTAQGGMNEKSNEYHGTSRVWFSKQLLTIVFDKQGELMGMFIIWFRLSIAASDIPLTWVLHMDLDLIMNVAPV